jgi:hypothetical protein
MTTHPSRHTNHFQVRSLQYRDLEIVERLWAEQGKDSHLACSMIQAESLALSRWPRWLQIFNWFPHPWRDTVVFYVAQLNQRVHGVIRVSPFNRTRSTWRVDQIAVESALLEADTGNGGVPTATIATASEIGSSLLRYCLENIWQARTWLLELDVNDQDALGLYRQNGFQLLAQTTYWSLSAEQLKHLADREPDLPNLRPVSNADAPLLYQLDNMAMPPLVRQVFDRHTQDFKTTVLASLFALVRQWLTRTESVSGYVFEPQRQVAIGYFQLQLCRNGRQPHHAHLTVHPAYTWLYPELMTQMARITQDVPPQELQLASADYHPEREEYLEGIGATRIAHTLMMSRSVWHKLREAKPASLDSLQLTEVLQGLQPAHKPVPGRISILKSIKHPQPRSQKSLADEPHQGDPTGC